MAKYVCTLFSYVVDAQIVYVVVGFSTIILNLRRSYVFLHNTMGFGEHISLYAVESISFFAKIIWVTSWHPSVCVSECVTVYVAY